MNIKKGATLKSLKSRLTKIKGESEALKIELNQKNKDYQSKLREIKIYEDEIKKIEKDDKIRVSEHAILRYFERVLGFNMDAVEKEILSKEVLSMIKTLGGNGSYPNKNFKVIMKDNTVTTII